MSGCCHVHYHSVTSRYVITKYRMIDRYRNDDYNDYVLSIKYNLKRLITILPAYNKNLSLYK